MRNRKPKLCKSLIFEVIQNVGARYVCYVKCSGHRKADSKMNRLSILTNYFVCKSDTKPNYKESQYMKYMNKEHEVIANLTDEYRDWLDKYHKIIDKAAKELNKISGENYQFVIVTEYGGTLISSEISGLNGKLVNIKTGKIYFEGNFDKAKLTYDK